MINQDDFVAKVDEDKFHGLLEDWKWLIGQPSRVCLVTALGDALVQRSDSKFAYLNTMIGTVVEVANGGDEFSSLLKEREFVMEYFAPEVIGSFYEHGHERLEPGKVFSMDVPYILGGEMEPSNFSPVDAEVHFSFAGQIHYQVKDLVPGTPIRINGVDYTRRNVE